MTAVKASDRPPAVEMVGIHKRFGAVLANADVNLTVAQGTVHGIVGENGAGKSTLMSVLYGFYSGDSGSIRVDGKPATIRNSHEAIALGIGMVHQHFMLVDTLSALENVMLGAEPHVLLHKAEALVRTSLATLMESTGLRVELDALVADLSVGDRQRLEILKALYRGARILILDEPTAVLTPQETEQLFGVLALLREKGTTILLITHKLKEVMRLCDSVTVMRGGRVVQDVAIKDTSVESLAEAMVGRKVQMGRQGDASMAPGAVLLKAHGVVVKDVLQVVRLHGFDVELRSGEIVGIAGVSGNGQSEVLEVLSGLLAPSAGEIVIGKTAFRAGAWMNPRMARSLGVAHVPEDRHERAMVMSFEAWESAALGYQWLPLYCHQGWMDHPQMIGATVDMMERFDVRPRNSHLMSASFSGGNQQKLVLARELGQVPGVLLVGQPTRGVDIGAIEFIYAQLRAMRDAGCAVLVVSSELDEILALADRVIVMSQGRISGELPISECSEAQLGMLMIGGTT
ncbi:MAG: ABC transporter ATP-binding protein [Burkholderiaceae bacterium]